MSVATPRLEYKIVNWNKDVKTYVPVQDSNFVDIASFVYNTNTEILVSTDKININPKNNKNIKSFLFNLNQNSFSVKNDIVYSKYEIYCGNFKDMTMWVTCMHLMQEKWCVTLPRMHPFIIKDDLIDFEIFHNNLISLENGQLRDHSIKVDLTKFTIEDFYKTWL